MAPGPPLSPHERRSGTGLVIFIGSHNSSGQQQSRGFDEQHLRGRVPDGDAEKFWDTFGCKRWLLEGLDLLTALTPTRRR